MASNVVELLRKNRHRIAVVEATTGGAISSSILGVPSSSRVFHSGVVVYTGPGMVQYLALPIIKASEAFRTKHNYKNKENYIKSKEIFVSQVAKGVWQDIYEKGQRQSKEATLRSGRAEWVIVESGTCGPEFYVPGVTKPFTAVGIAFPSVTDPSIPTVNTFVLEIDEVYDRQTNMLKFKDFSLSCLLKCLKDYQPIEKSKL